MPGHFTHASSNTLSRGPVDARLTSCSLSVYVSYLRDPFYTYLSDLFVLPHDKISPGSIANKVSSSSFSSSLFKNTVKYIRH